MESEPKTRTSGSRLAGQLGVLWVIALSWSCSSWWYVAYHRPTHPIVKLGLVYPIAYRSIYVYVTRFEYILIGPPMFCATLVIGVSFTAAAFLANASKNSNGRTTQ
jgi:hypothetical protein